MTVTTFETIGCKEQDVPMRAEQERIPLAALPKLVWVGGALFVTNLLVGIGMLITPNLEIDPFGKEVQSYDVASSKVSPFTQTVDTAKRKVRAAAKLRPVTFIPAPEEEIVASASSPLETSDWLRATELERQVSRSRELDLPRASRVSHELDMPVKTEHALYYPRESKDTLRVYDDGRSYDMPRASFTRKTTERSTDVAPRRASEKNFVVIN